MPSEYINEVLKDKSDNNGTRRYDEERRIRLKELEHLIYRLRELSESYSTEKLPVDIDFLELVHRIGQIHERLQLVDRRLRNPKFK